MTTDYAYDKNGQLTWTKEELQAAYEANPEFFTPNSPHHITKMTIANNGEIIMEFQRIAKYRVVQDRLSAAQPFATQVIVTDGGPWAEHNVPCAVCGDNAAVFDLNKGVFMPCDTCKLNGWSLALVKKHWWQFWRRRG